MGIGKQDGAVRRQLRTLFNVGAIRELTDGQLLERFATERGEAAELAFAVLVERHGPMVLRVCRGVLADADAAQDAFQATFLVLVRRARGLWVRDSIGPWLHQVAYRTASCARAAAARRRRLERRAARDEQEVRPERDVELERLLHEEIDRLPDRYRSPIVLCDLEGRTHEQAARSLGWPVGTVKTRLSRGRARLRDRLIRRGVGTELGPLAVVAAFKVPAVSIPPGLLDATTAAALRFAAAGPVVRGAAVTIAEGALRTMTTPQWWKVAAVLVVAGATASGVEWLGGGMQSPVAGQENPLTAGDAPTREVRRGRLELVVSSPGYVEAAQTTDVYCNVEGGTTIIKIVPEGSHVKKGDVIAELDSAALRDQLINQRITTRAAEANYRNARLVRERAEVGVREYTDGRFKNEDEALRRAIDGSRAAIRRIEARLERTRKASEELGATREPAGGARTPAEVVARLDVLDRIDEAELALDRERQALAQAEGKRDTLEKFTRDRTIRGLEEEVKKARSEELAREATWELEKGKEAKLAKQIANCVLTAPVDGTVQYARDQALVGQTTIEEGATVRERQKVVRILNFDGPLLVVVKVPSAAIASVTPKMKAMVKVDAFANRTLAGVVSEIAPLPDPSHGGGFAPPVYTTRIQLGGGHPELRPGMTARADIIVCDRDEAIGVPAESLVHYDEKDHLAVKAPDGRVEWRDVIAGASDGATVEIKEGLAGGERVILQPGRFLTPEQRARLRTPPPNGPKKAAPPRKKR